MFERVCPGQARVQQGVEAGFASGCWARRGREETSRQNHAVEFNLFLISCVESPAYIQSIRECHDIVLALVAG